jgi:hypothetical protein
MSSDLTWERMLCGPQVSAFYEDTSRPYIAAAGHGSHFPTRPDGLPFAVPGLGFPKALRLPVRCSSVPKRSGGRTYRSRRMAAALGEQFVEEQYAVAVRGSTKMVLPEC